MKLSRRTWSYIGFLAAFEPFAVLLGLAMAGVGWGGHYVATNQPIPLLLRVFFVVAGHSIIAMPLLIVWWDDRKCERVATTGVAP